jgi:hypothetical protein
VEIPGGVRTIGSPRAAGMARGLRLVGVTAVKTSLCSDNAMIPFGNS